MISSVDSHLTVTEAKHDTAPNGLGEIRVKLSCLQNFDGCLEKFKGLEQSITSMTSSVDSNFAVTKAKLDMVQHGLDEIWTKLSGLEHLSHNVKRTPVVSLSLGETQIFSAVLVDSDGDNTGETDYATTPVATGVDTQLPCRTHNDLNDA